MSRNTLDVRFFECGIVAINSNEYAYGGYPKQMLLEWGKEGDSMTIMLPDGSEHRLTKQIPLKPKETVSNEAWADALASEICQSKFNPAFLFCEMKQLILKHAPK